MFALKKGMDDVVESIILKKGQAIDLDNIDDETQQTLFEIADKNINSRKMISLLSAKHQEANIGIAHGMFKCFKPCRICDYVKMVNFIQSKFGDAAVWLMNHFTCDSSDICYIIECRRCGDQYIGETGQSLRERF